MNITTRPIWVVVLCALAGSALAEQTRTIEGTSLSWPTGKTIVVWPDDAKEPTKLRPRWIGGAPADGGHFDEAMVEKLKKVEEGSRVRIQYIEEEGPRVVGVEVVTPANHDGGTATGKVIAKQRNALIVKTADGPVMRFMPKWVGGAPKDGGHLDEAGVKAVRETAEGREVVIRWSYDERPRIESLEVKQTTEQD